MRSRLVSLILVMMLALVLGGIFAVALVGLPRPIAGYQATSNL